MLNNYGSHFIDQYFSLFGTALARRHMETRRIVSGGDAEDMVKAQLIRPDGLIFDLEINMASAFDSSAWELHGERGSARLHPAERRWELRTLAALPPLRIDRELAAAGRRYPSERLDWQTSSISFADMPPGPFYDRVAGYLAGTEPPLVPLGDTLALLELLDFARSTSPAAESVKERSHESLPAALQSRPPSSVRSGPML